MIGSLLYLTASMPYITFAVGVCARYQAQPKMSHLIQVKRILKYINGTCDYGILYSQENMKDKTAPETPEHVTTSENEKSPNKMMT
ncbi:gag-pol polyprotein, partial [Trifolium medium]|nr:gag-pol polyprotein [Trifolium medium]